MAPVCKGKLFPNFSEKRVGLTLQIEDTVKKVNTDKQAKRRLTTTSRVIQIQEGRSVNARL